MNINEVHLGEDGDGPTIGQILREVLTRVKEEDSKSSSQLEASIRRGEEIAAEILASAPDVPMATSTAVMVAATLVARVAGGMPDPLSFIAKTTEMFSGGVDFQLGSVLAGKLERVVVRKEDSGDDR